jgi:hypothetical protein
LCFADLPQIAKPLEICGGRDLLGLVFGPSLLAFGGLALPTFKKGFSTGVGSIQHATILRFGDINSTPDEPEGSHIGGNATQQAPVMRASCRELAMGNLVTSAPISASRESVRLIPNLQASQSLSARVG